MAEANRQSRQGIITLGAIAVVLGVIVVAFVLPEQRRAAREGAYREAVAREIARLQAPSGESVRDEEITAYKFGLIQNGQTKEQVFDIVKNASGELLVDSEIAGIRGQAYQWKSRGGGVLMVQFQDGRVVMKSQSGLR